MNSGCSTYSSCRPETGRTCTRGPATSVRAGRDHQVDAGALEVPAEPLEDAAGQAAGGGDRDGVDAEPGHGLGHAGQRADDRHRRSRRRRRAACRHRSPSGRRTAHARARRPARRPPRGRRRRAPGATSGWSGAGRGAGPCGRAQRASSSIRVPTEKAKRQHEPRQLELDHVAGDGDEAPEVHAGAHHAAVLVAADSEDAAVVGAGGDQHADPGDGEDRSDHDVRRQLDRR